MIEVPGEINIQQFEGSFDQVEKRGAKTKVHEFGSPPTLQCFAKPHFWRHEKQRRSSKKGLINIKSEELASPQEIATNINLKKCLKKGRTSVGSQQVTSQNNSEDRLKKNQQSSRNETS